MTLKWEIAQYLELQWWKRYLAGKDKTAYYQWKRRYWTALLAEIQDTLSLSTATIIADLGCGPAGIFTIFDNKQVIALDPLLDMYNGELPFFDKTDFPYTNFLSQPIEEFVADQPFDIIFCMNAINHVADIDMAYDRMSAALKPTGQLVVSIDAHNYSFFKRLFRLLPGDALHPHQHDLNEYRTFMTARGFEIVKSVALKSEFLFTHYVLVAKRGK